jgi:hypothetical protein
MHHVSRSSMFFSHAFWLGLYANLGHVKRRYCNHLPRCILLNLAPSKLSEFQPLDSASVLKTLALWQQQDNCRAVLLVTPGSGFEPGEGRRLDRTVEEGLSLAGWVRPIKVILITTAFAELMVMMFV